MYTKFNPKHFLIVRLDNIGDLLLSLATCTYIKHNFPNARITLLARDYVKSIANICNSIDEFIPIENFNFLEEPLKTKRKLRDLNIDVCINLSAHCRKNVHYYINKTRGSVKQLTKFIDNYMSQYNGLHIKRAKVYSMTLTKIWIYNIFLSQKYFQYLYSKSAQTYLQHEAYRNLICIKRLGITKLPSIEELPKLYNLNPNKLQLNKNLQNVISPDKFNLILHPKSNGNCIEWPIANYIQLINLLDATKFRIILTGSPEEKQYTQSILQNIDKNKDAIDLAGQTSPEDLPALIYQADGLVAGSTGPMHIAAALGINTLGIFPYDPKSKMYKKWFPIGNKAHSIVNVNIDELSPERVLETIMQEFS